jgi:ankyrin repeat protein
VDLLIQAGADIHLSSTEYGIVPLEIASGSGHTETVRRLLQAGAPVNHQRKGGFSAVFLASQGGHTDVVDPQGRS